MTTNIKLPFKKETKNTLQYHSEQDGLPVPTLYVKKDMFDSSKPWPKFLKISVEGVNK